MKTADEQNRVQANERKNLRTPLIVLRMKLESKGNTFFGYAKNISRGGMFISSINPQEPGAQFKVEFPLPEPFNSTIKCACEVVWKRLWEPKTKYEPGMGLKFLDLSNDSADKIDSWVKM
ncbi:MAG: PilZ domain-containing protein [Deltaproteobacteria bacterium]|nr:PilZ domain-containing protein [Deltaproteobacteria bacterium]MBW1873397.1 PilZ domain-containing protein [Deltaproteobacteria bacterium]